VRLKGDLNFLNAALEPESSTELSASSSDSDELSAWVRSPARRVFDLVIVVVMIPILLPLLLIVGSIVRLTSSGPAIFLQKRVGRNGSLFTIYKFRTMKLSHERRGLITTINDPTITNVGRYLRWWKLDELPQFLNVLRGEMSLVGPRPKVPEQQITLLKCRPGITGAATIAFAQEELLLVEIPEEQLEEHFRNVILLLKDTLDANYMANATPLSDLRLLLHTAIRRWDRANISHLREPT
jgi:lipopolysaccharide/colanic/teichoic acid biosynthesis glycosyltransferase